MELRAAGVSFSRNESGRMVVRGPKTLDIRAAVLEHMQCALAWIDGGKNHIESRRWGECEACKLPMPSHRGGLCDVCSCAAQKIFDERKLTAPPPGRAERVVPDVIETDYREPPWEKHGGLVACQGFEIHGDVIIFKNFELPNKN